MMPLSICSDTSFTTHWVVNCAKLIWACPRATTFGLAAAATLGAKAAGSEAVEDEAAESAALEVAGAAGVAGRWPVSAAMLAPAIPWVAPLPLDAAAGSRPLRPSTLLTLAISISGLNGLPR